MAFQHCIDINLLTKRYNGADQDSLKDVSFAIYKGEKFGVLGPNGAGKTTLISILCGIIKQSGGGFAYFMDGSEQVFSDMKHHIGFVPQDYAFYEELTAWQNMYYFGSLFHIPKKEIHSRTEEIFHVLGLTKFAFKKTKIFSGGMKRRMNLAIGIIHRPAILFLDEPTVGADVQSKHAMMEYLNRLNANGTTIVYTSHHMSEAQEFVNRIAFINLGELIACDQTATLLEKHHAPDLKSLFIQLTGEGYPDSDV
jgi:ABC-2 type transport system ATP-binding protein